MTGPVVGVDLGKTGCRVAVSGPEGTVSPLTGTGAPGLADAGGVDRAFDTVHRVASAALAGQTPERVGLGVAGAEAAPEQAEALARRLARVSPGAHVAIASDSVTAHAGAFAGGPGTVLAVGTGAVALGLASDGRLARFDGWGPWLGDDGGGAWIGRAGLRAVLLAREGRGQATALTELARERYGPPETLPRAIAAAGAVARTTAAFVPDVVRAAAAGDSVASEVLDRAARAWSELVTAAADVAEEETVAVVGGLADVPLLMDRLVGHLPDRLRLRPAEGTPLDGALLLAARTDAPHEAAVTRVVETARPGGRPDLDLLATEQARVDLDLDARPPEELVALLLEAEATVPAALEAASDALVAAVRLGGDALSRGGRLLYVGAGTPGRLAALDAAECPPTFGTDPDRVVALVAGGERAERRAVEGAEDDAEAGAADLAALGVSPLDLVVGISASGRTPYVLAALATARDAGAATVAVVNNPGSPAARLADVSVELLTGAEVLAGSTRLKAGTAQKITLNVISTGSMVAAGRTYGPWMVDVVASNEKLRRRAQRILVEATGADGDLALATLEAADWSTKTALVALSCDVSVGEARRRLSVMGGRVRAALGPGVVAVAP